MKTYNTFFLIILSIFIYAVDAKNPKPKAGTAKAGGSLHKSASTGDVPGEAAKNSYVRLVKSIQEGDVTEVELRACLELNRSYIFRLRSAKQLLGHAIDNQRYKLALVILEFDNNVDYMGPEGSYLHILATQPDTEELKLVVDKLLEKGASKELMDNSQNTAKQIALKDIENKLQFLNALGYNSPRPPEFKFPSRKNSKGNAAGEYLEEDRFAIDYKMYGLIFGAVISGWLLHSVVEKQTRKKHPKPPYQNPSFIRS